MNRFAVQALLAATLLLPSPSAPKTQPRTGSDLLPHAGPWGSGWEPSDVAIADLDGDGDADLVVSYGFTAKLNVCLGDGTGSFEGLAEIDTEPGVSAVAVGHCGKERMPFVAALNPKTERLAVYVREGTGSFALPGTEYATGKDPVDVVVAYEDRERTRPVVAVVNRGSHDLSLLVWSDEGIFEPRSMSLARTPGQEPGPIAAASGDFDGDGREDDIAVLNGKYATVALLTGKGGGGFERKHKDFRVEDHSENIAAGVIGLGRVPILAVADRFTGEIVIYIQSRESVFGFRTFGTVHTGRGGGPVALTETGTMGAPLLAAADAARGLAVAYLVEPDGETNFIGQYPVDDKPRAAALGCLAGPDKPFLVIAGRRLYTIPLFMR
jgi:hypothetical protein